MIGSLHSQQQILVNKWHEFWCRRRLIPAWAQSSEAIQFAICLEHASIFLKHGHRLPDGECIKRVLRPKRHMDCVLELKEPAFGMKPNKQLLQDLEKTASRIFGGVKSFNTWYGCAFVLSTFLSISSDFMLLCGLTRAARSWGSICVNPAHVLGCRLVKLSHTYHQQLKRTKICL